MKKKRNPNVARKQKPLEGMQFGEAIARFVQTIPAELHDAIHQFEKLKEEADEFEEDVRKSQTRTASRLKGRRRRGKED